MAKPKTKNNRKPLKKAIRRQQPLHKRALLHPITIFGLLCLGVLIGGTTYNAIAENYTVKAVVPAAPLTEGAVITSPATGYTTSTASLTVSGTCPQQSYINLLRNGAFSGSAWCQPDNTFSIAATLSPGINTLTAQDYNITDQPGPATPSKEVIYQPDAQPGPAVPPATAAGQTVVSANEVIVSPDSAKSRPGLPLLLTSDYSFKSFIRGNAFSWTIDLGGGTPPYKVHIDWNDKSVSNIIFARDPVFTISHIYKKPGYYPVLIYVLDAKGDTAILQLAALIKNPGEKGIAFAGTKDRGGTAAAGILPNSSLFLSGNRWLWVAWPTYTILVLMTISFFLGERQEYARLSARRHTRRHRTA